jgi:hypothetical protein
MSKSLAKNEKGWIVSITAGIALILLAPPSFAFRHPGIGNTTVTDIDSFDGVGYIKYTNKGRTLYSIATLLSYNGGGLALTNNCEGKGQIFFKNTLQIPVNCHKIGTGNVSIAVLPRRAPSNIKRHRISRNRRRQGGQENLMIGFSCDSFGQHVGLENNVFTQMRSATFSHGAQTDVLCPSTSGDYLYSIGGGAPVFDQSGFIVGMGGYYRNSDLCSDPGLYMVCAISRVSSDDWSDVYEDVIGQTRNIASFGYIDNLGRRDVCYRAHVQSYGWMPIKCNGEIAGTTGESKRLEAIQIWTKKLSCYGLSNNETSIRDEPNFACNGEKAGVVGKKRQSSFFYLKPNEVIYGRPNEYSTISFRVHSSRVGWLPWKHAEYGGYPAISGAMGKYIQAVRIMYKPITANQSNNQPNKPKPNSKNKPFATPIQPTIRQIPGPTINRFTGL